MAITDSATLGRTWRHIDKIRNRTEFMASRIRKYQTPATDNSGSCQRLSSGDGACRRTAAFRRETQCRQWAGVILGFCSLYFISRVGGKEGISMKSDKWVWMAIGATVMGAVSALYDKYLLTRYEPLEVQARYSLYQMVIMGITIGLILRGKGSVTGLQWRWTIPLISLFLTVADIAYFYSLSLDGSMIAVVSMIRRGSVIVSFFYGVIALHEKNIRLKIIDLTLLLVGLTFLVIGSL